MADADFRFIVVVGIFVVRCRFQVFGSGVIVGSDYPISWKTVLLDKEMKIIFN